MVEKTIRDGESKIEASDETLVLADAIYSGLSEIASAIREVGKMLNEGEDVGEPVEHEFYLDGSRVENS